MHGMNDRAPDGRLRRDVPVAARQSSDVWGSDAIAALLRATGHSLRPAQSRRRASADCTTASSTTSATSGRRCCVCLHEEHVVAIAHGYAKVTGKPLLGIVHSNVGLMHASMAIYDAWCDRVPVILLGATGPVDAASGGRGSTGCTRAATRRRWCAPFVKWDDQPASVAAAFESLLRARQIARHRAARVRCTSASTSSTQEAEARRRCRALPDVARYRPPPPARAAPSSSPARPSGLRGAKRPLMLMGRVSRDERRLERARRARRDGSARGC